MKIRDAQLSAAGAGDKTYVEDVFSTYLYTGNGLTQTINNGIDLAGKGGMVWVKNRSLSDSHIISDTNRGNSYYLSSQSTSGQNLDTTNITSFSSSGFSVGTNGSVNNTGNAFASWTFRKAPKFFDVVTYTGNGAASKVIQHNLGSVPGMIITKSTTVANNWWTYHRGVGNTAAMRLQTTDASLTASTLWNNTDPTASNFTVGVSVNETGQTYVAYLFAHDTTTDGLIQCGSFTGAATVNLGWEPQYILFKRTDGTQDWFVMDNMRGIGASGAYNPLNPNLSAAEGAFTGGPTINATGFTWIPGATASYIYMAIRRPMKVPTDGTKVFSPNASSSAGGTKVTTNFPIDSQWMAYRPGDGGNTTVVDRLRGVSTNSTSAGGRIRTSSTVAEETATLVSRFWDNTGFQIPPNYESVSTMYWNFRRAPGFFDVVCYTGDSATSHTIKHNLKAVPELMIVKSRSSAVDWCVYNKTNGSSSYLLLNTTAALASSSAVWAATTPTDTSFYVGQAGYTNNVSTSYVAYLFASCPGVSKVGSYTGNGSSQTINCGFTNGARFVLIKRTDSTGDWYVWDTARGIVAGNDPYLSLNSTAAEVTTDDTIDPDSTGFIVNQDAATNVNVNNATYIYLAIA